MELWVNEIAFMMRPVYIVTPDVPMNVTEGQVLTFNARIDNFGFSAALIGEITMNVPTGLGNLTDPATMPFNIPPGAFHVCT